MVDLVHDRSRIGAVGASLELARETDRVAAGLSWAVRDRAIFSRSGPQMGKLWLLLAELGDALKTADAWIAATAVLYDAPLITHNVSDYLGVPGLKLVADPHE
jgi:predicted nucleic acid-binding protein